MYLQLLKSDIHCIGDTIYPNDEGNCVFVFDGDLDAFGIKRIFLRNLLPMFGEQYRIISEDEYVNDKFEFSIYLTTNLPWKEYCEDAEKRREE